MSSWPHWVEQLVQLSKAEAATRPVVRKLTKQVQVWTIRQVCGMHVKVLICYYCCVMCYQTLLQGLLGYVISLQR